MRERDRAYTRYTNQLRLLCKLYDTIILRDTGKMNQFHHEGLTKEAAPSPRKGQVPAKGASGTRHRIARQLCLGKSVGIAAL